MHNIYIYIIYHIYIRTYERIVHVMCCGARCEKAWGYINEYIYIIWRTTIMEMFLHTRILILIHIRQCFLKKGKQREKERKKKILSCEKFNVCGRV